MRCSGWPDRPPVPLASHSDLGFPSARLPVWTGLPGAGISRLHRYPPARATLRRRLIVLSSSWQRAVYLPASCLRPLGRTVRAFAPAGFPAFIATTPLADFCATVDPPHGGPSPGSCRGTAQISPDKPHPFHHTVAVFTLSSLDRYGLRGHLPARPLFAPYQTVLVHRPVVLLRASSGRDLAAAPLRFAILRPDRAGLETFTPEV
jgi:hypothetical protein